MEDCATEPAKSSGGSAGIKLAKNGASGKTQRSYLPRKPAVVPKQLLKAWIPLELRARLDLLLHSELEGRVPLGRYSAFVAERLREHFEWVEIDLALYGFPQGYFTRAPKEMAAALIRRLNAKP